MWKDKEEKQEEEDGGWKGNENKQVEKKGWGEGVTALACIPVAFTGNMDKKPRWETEMRLPIL